MQASQHVHLVEASACELLQVVRHAWVIRLATKQRSISLAHEVFSVKPQQVVHVIMILMFQVSVGRTGRRAILGVDRAMLVGNVGTNLVH